MTFSDINFHPDDHELRVFSAIWLVGFAVFGIVAAWRGGAFSAGIPLGWHAPWRPALVFWGLALIGAAVGLAAPRAMRPVFVAWMVAAFPIGWTVSLLLLALVYYVVFTGFGLLFRAMRRDALGRCFDRTASSYWVPRR
jgi:hypothetical protein